MIYPYQFLDQTADALGVTVPTVEMLSKLKKLAKLGVRMHDP